MKLFFYDVDIDYVNYLKEVETQKRGFTRVPDIQYANERKMICGVVLAINGYKYYVPVSSYKKQQSNNLLIRLKDDAYNQVKGSLRFNYMFPVEDKYVTRRDFNTSSGWGRQEFLRRQWVYCNAIVDEIEQMARNTYEDVVYGKDANIKRASCDFRILEEAADNFILNREV